MATIDIERLGVLLDHGTDARAAAHQAQTNLQEAQMAARHHEGTADELAALLARVARRALEQDAVARRASLWSNYCDGLRALAQKHGVSL